MTEQKTPRASSIAFEKRYSDDSGVEFAVRLVRGRGAYEYEVEFEAVDTVRFPESEIGWLLACLERIRDEETSDAHKEGT